MFETDAVRMWHLGDDVGIVSFKSKGHTIGKEVLDGVNRALDEAEKNCAGLVIWQTKEPFSFGANLAELAPALAAKQWERIDSRRRRLPADGAAAALQPDPDGLRGSRHGARRLAASSSCMPTASSPRSSPTSDWSRSASDCFRPAAD